MALVKVLVSIVQFLFIPYLCVKKETLCSKSITCLKIHRTYCATGEKNTISEIQ